MNKMNETPTKMQNYLIMWKKGKDFNSQMNRITNANNCFLCQ